MALLPLYRVNRGGRYHQFPIDFTLVDHALVDDNVLPHLVSVPINCWSLKMERSTRYARCKKGSAVFYVHRIVWELIYGPIPPGKTVDHKDFNGLNCHIGNLRLASELEQKIHHRKRAINRAGTLVSSKYKGVCRQPRNSPNNPWTAQIRINSTQTYLGVYSSEAEAACAFNVAAQLTQPEDFRVLNEIPVQDLGPQKRREVEARVRSRLGL